MVSRERPQYPDVGRCRHVTRVLESVYCCQVSLRCPLSRAISGTDSGAWELAASLVGAVTMNETRDGLRFVFCSNYTKTFVLFITRFLLR